MIAVKVHKPQSQVLPILLYLTILRKFSSLDFSVTGALGTVEVKKREAEIDIASFKAERLQDSLMREQEKYRVSLHFYQILICVNNKLSNNFKICWVCDVCEDDATNSHHSLIQPPYLHIHPRLAKGVY